jgi:hypothetical protein
MRTAVTVAGAVFVFTLVVWLGFARDRSPSSADSGSDAFVIAGTASLIAPVDGGTPFLQVEDGRTAYFVKVSSATELKRISRSPEGILWRLRDGDRYGVRGPIVTRDNVTFIDATYIEYLGRQK